MTMWYCTHTFPQGSYLSDLTFECDTFLDSREFPLFVVRQEAYLEERSSYLNKLNRSVGREETTTSTKRGQEEPYV